MNNLMNVNQAEELLRSKEVVKVSASSMEYVEGKQLLDVCGLSYRPSNWGDKLKRQIEKHGLIENKDYAVGNSIPPLMGENSKGGRPQIEYRFTVNAANHILLAAMTRKGKEARQQAIDLAVAVQSNPVASLGSNYAQAYIGLARHRAGMTADKLVRWRSTLSQDIKENGVIKATESFMESTSAKACNQLTKEARATLLLDAENHIKSEQDAYRRNADKFDTREYEAFNKAALMLSDRRALVLSRRVTELTK